MLVCWFVEQDGLPPYKHISYIPLAVPECSRLVLSLSFFAVVVVAVVFVIVCVGMQC